MLPVRRLPALLALRAAGAYHALLSVIRNAGVSSFPYQPLGQSPLPTTADGASKARRRGQSLFIWKVVAFATGLAFVLATLVIYSHRAASTPSLGVARAGIGRAKFIDAILREPVEGVLDPRPIQKKCEETKFHQGLVWHCAAVVGGIGNVANMVLNCIRYAIEAGATTLILPRLGVRSDDLVDLGGEDKSVELNHFFDIPYFLSSWQQVCPQIRAVVSDMEVPYLASPNDSPRISPSSVKEFPMKKYLIVDPTGWREAFDAWIAKNSVFDRMSTASPVRLWQNLVLAQWNREAHPAEFANSFPRLLRSPMQTRRLAASALWNLEKVLGRPVVADAIVRSSQSSGSPTVNSLRSHRLVPNGFLGVHLRVAADAAKAGWAGYDAQAPFYIAEAKRLNLKTIYLATGSAEHRERFRMEAARQGLTVIVKENLLDEEEQEELKGLTWDQQALVDFDVLMYSTRFYGFVRSSFSWSLALRRGILPDAGVSGSVDGDSKEDEYRDSLSAIVGRYDNINPEGLWP